MVPRSHLEVNWMPITTPATRRRAFGDRRAQGTVEYLGLVLAVGALLLAVSVHVKGGGDGIGGQISKS
ncbi:MAG: hypothetical protein RL190_686, partial [Actinomycetota bacterium]